MGSWRLASLIDKSISRVVLDIGNLRFFSLKLVLDVEAGVAIFIGLHFTSSTCSSLIWEDSAATTLIWEDSAATSLIWEDSSVTSFCDEISLELPLAKLFSIFFFWSFLVFCAKSGLRWTLVRWRLKLQIVHDPFCDVQAIHCGQSTHLHLALNIPVAGSKVPCMCWGPAIWVHSDLANNLFIILAPLTLKFSSNSILSWNGSTSSFAFFFGGCFSIFWDPPSLSYESSLSFELSQDTSLEIDLLNNLNWHKTVHLRLVFLFIIKFSFKCLERVSDCQ